jgi:limonene 1,2-monooxygenase
LILATNWAEWENTKKSYELYARFVMPHFAKVNEHRRQSFERLKEDFAVAAPEVQKSIEMAFARWKEKKAAKSPAKA